MLCIYKQDGEKKISFQSEIGFVIKGNTTIAGKISKLVKLPTHSKVLDQWSVKTTETITHHIEKIKLFRPWNRER